MTNERSDDALLRLIGAGDPCAFHDLMGRHGRLMLSVAQRATGNAADADEIVQEAFLKVWTQAAHWKPDGAAKFSTWVYRVVLNASLDRCRRKSALPLDTVADPEDPAPGGFESAAGAQRHRMIVAALDNLPTRQKEAMTLYFFGDMSAPGAARLLDMSLPAFEALLVRGKRSLKKELLRRGITSLGELL